MPTQTQGRAEREATELFLFLGFQLSDDNDCHRFTESPLARIALFGLAEFRRGLTEAAKAVCGICRREDWPEASDTGRTYIHGRVGLCAASDVHVLLALSGTAS